MKTCRQFLKFQGNQLTNNKYEKNNEKEIKCKIKIRNLIKVSLHKK